MKAILTLLFFMFFGRFAVDGGQPLMAQFNGRKFPGANIRSLDLMPSIKDFIQEF